MEVERVNAHGHIATRATERGQAAIDSPSMMQDFAGSPTTTAAIAGKRRVKSPPLRT
jgi:hypothetical protein